MDDLGLDVHDPAIAWAIAASMLAVPAAVGWAAGLGSARWLARRPLARAAIVAALLALAWWAIVPLRAVSAWDVLVGGAILAATFASGSRRPGPRPSRRARVVYALLLVATFGAIEFGARTLAGPPGMTFHGLPEQPLFFDDADREFGTAALWPERSRRAAFRDLPSSAGWARRPGVRRVLHVGDSMVAAADTDPGTSFEEVLARTVGGEHLNLGVSNTGTDFELLSLRGWVPRLTPDEVVLYVFTGNDIDEIDRAYYSCGGGPLLGAASAGLPSRCPAPTYAPARATLLAQGPSPLPLRGLAAYSATLAHVTTGFERSLSRWRDRAGPQNPEPSWTRYGEILAAIRDELAARRVPLRVVVLPARAALDPAESRWLELARDTQARAVAVARSLGLDVHDPSRTLAAAIAARPGARWFAGQGPHFAPDGHAVFAAWLADELGWAGARPASVAR